MDRRDPVRWRNGEPEVVGWLYLLVSWVLIFFVCSCGLFFFGLDSCPEFGSLRLGGLASVFVHGRKDGLHAPLRDGVSIEIFELTGVGPQLDLVGNAIDEMAAIRDHRHGWWWDKKFSSLATQDESSELIWSDVMDVVQENGDSLSVFRRCLIDEPEAIRR